MKKTMMCLTAVAWLWIAKGQERGIAQRDTQKPVKTQRVVSFKPDDRSPEKTLQDLLNPGKDLKFVKLKSKQDVQAQIVTDIYDQYYKGVPVEGGQIRVVTQKGKIKYALQDYAEISTNLNTSPKLSKEQALNIAIQKKGAKKYAWQDPDREKSLKERKKDPAATYYPKPELVVLADIGKLAYKMEVYALDPWTREEVYVDAQNGQLIKSQDLMTHEYGSEHLTKAPDFYKTDHIQAANLEPAWAHFRINGYDFLSPTAVYDNQKQQYYLNDLGNKIHTQSIGGVSGIDPVGPFQEFNSPYESPVVGGDYRALVNPNFRVAQVVNLALSQNYNYYQVIHNRMGGFDGTSSPLKAYVYDYKLGGSFYDREETLFFPYDDGLYDAEIQVEPVMQTVFHELAHAFTVSESGLTGGSYEPGILNEALSDIWAYTVADYFLKEHPSEDIVPDYYKATFGNNWVSSSGNQEFQDWYKTTHGYSVNRISKDPNSDNHPDFYMGAYWNDHKHDPHFNSTVISYWYYLLSVGGTVNPENDPGNFINIAGIGIEKAAKIIYLTTTNLLNSTTDFQGFALRTKLAAKLIYGDEAAEVNSVVDAWAAVGLGDLNFSSPIGCVPPADYNPKMFIDKFELANVTTEKPKDFIGGYQDYGFLNIEGKSGYTYDLIINDVKKPYTPVANYWSVWIDIDGNNTFEPNEKIASGFPNSPNSITLPSLLKGGKSILRVVLSPDQNASPCFNPQFDKAPKYMEDYGITIYEYCPIVKSTVPAFTALNPKFDGINFNNIALTECGGLELFNETPLSQQTLIDKSDKILQGGEAYSLTFNFKSADGVKLNPGGGGFTNTFLTDCNTHPPYGFSLGDVDDDPSKDGQGDDGGAGSGLEAKCPLVTEDLQEFLICPQRFRRLVWIDFNRNGSFETNEKYDSVFDPLNKNFYVNFRVPNWATTLEGKTRIRIYAYLGNGALFDGSPCGEGINGYDKEIFDGETVISKNAIDIDVSISKSIFVLKMMPAPENKLSESTEASLEPVSLLLYPNPASNLVDLSVKGTSTDNFTLELYNSEGMRLLVKQPWDGRSLDVSSYPAGIYLITLRRDREVYTQKLIIER